MADEHTSGGNSSKKVELTETQILMKEEVAKTLEAVLPTYIEGTKSSLKEFIHQELADFEAEAEMKQLSKKITIKEFMACKPAEFKGEVDPLISQRWISDIEIERSCQGLVGVVEEGKGQRWNERADQKDESIDTITAIFFDKAKFCPDILQTERMWINRYHNMLNTKYREFLTPSKCETLNELIDFARERELEFKRQEDQGDKRKDIGGVSALNLRGAVPINDDGRSFKSQGSGKKPEAPKPKGRALQISGEEAKVKSDVVTGIIVWQALRDHPSTPQVPTMKVTLWQALRGQRNHCMASTERPSVYSSSPDYEGIGTVSADQSLTETWGGRRTYSSRQLQVPGWSIDHRNLDEQLLGFSQLIELAPWFVYAASNLSV
ncbi:hypothetical protein E3N88_17276 [Mikania micrantha]|uniref:Uncharacterized protein n=1 Tax=Mikania micrantha TaxID=192012 RepID=A0A5N6NSW4_9ASTR|nr:hypothetical protein E3N88_17276 [Mikania micrantha]